MGVSSPKLSLLTIDKGIKLLLALKSHGAFPISESLMVQGMVKLPGSYIFISKVLLLTALQVVVMFTTLLENFPFLLSISFMNLA